MQVPIACALGRGDIGYSDSHPVGFLSTGSAKVILDTINLRGNNRHFMCIIRIKNKWYAC